MQKIYQKKRVILWSKATTWALIWGFSLYSQGYSDLKNTKIGWSSDPRQGLRLQYGTSVFILRDTVTKNKYQKLGDPLIHGNGRGFNIFFLFCYGPCLGFGLFSLHSAQAALLEEALVNCWAPLPYSIFWFNYEQFLWVLGIGQT